MEGRIPPLEPAERAELDAVAEWRKSKADGWYRCDPSLDDAIEALSPVARRLIAEGRNLTFEQAQALSPQAEEILRDNSNMGEVMPSPEPEQ